MAPVTLSSSSRTGGPIRVVLADDHPVVREGLTGVLGAQSDLVVVGKAENGREAVLLVSALRPDVVLMDLRMPELDGVEATAEIGRVAPDTRVVVLTTYDTDADILRAVEAGATGYLLKDAAPDVLAEAVRAAARGETVLAPRVVTRLAERTRAPHDALTPRETDVLDLVARGASNREAASQLGIGEATVKSHLQHVFTKLGVDDRTAAVTRAMGMGLIRTP